MFDAIWTRMKISTLGDFLAGPRPQDSKQSSRYKETLKKYPNPPAANITKF